MALPGHPEPGNVSDMKNTDLNAEIAASVDAAMRTRGVTQEQLADSTGIALRTLQRRLGGESDWTTGEIAKIARSLKVSVSSLIDPPSREHGYPEPGNHAA